MPVSEQPDATRASGSPGRFFAALGHLTALIAIVWGVSWAVASSRASLLLYRRAYGNSVAHRFAGKLAEVGQSAGPTCLLLGASTTREGFDEGLMEKAAPGVTFLNGGTSRGTVFLYEALALMLRRYDVRPDCVVVCLHPWLLRDLPLPLVAQGYTDLLDFWTLLSLTEIPSEAGERERALAETAKNAVLPTRSLARQMSRLVRSQLYRSQPIVCWKASLPRPAFEFFENELEPSPRFYYSESVPWSEEKLASFFESGRTTWLDRRRYGHPEHEVSLRRTLDLVIEQSSVVVLVTMPEHSRTRESITPWVVSRYERIVREYERKGCFYINLASFLPDDEILDLAHALPAGREKLSVRVAKAVRRRLKRGE